MRWFGAAMALTLAPVAASCSDADEPAADTLDSLVDGTAAVSVLTEAAAQPSTTVDAPDGTRTQAGSGIISIQVRLATSGVDETLRLDRATVTSDELDPISLFASCPALDGGDEFIVTVTDLRRLATGDHVVALRLAAVGEVTGPGEHEATLEVADSAQVSTTYTGTMALDDELSSGTFDVIDPEGNAATGAFRCADHSISSTSAAPSTTRPPSREGATTPPGSPPPTSPAVTATPPTPAATTAPAAITLPPAVTVPSTSITY